ncbi:MAG: hypothetical protein IKP34_04880, partial [Bacteroidales bacterium]|nr:hypothetical protein [Bacteroidales bacterium]
LDVRLLSAFKADNKRTSSGQQADNKRCWYGEKGALEWPKELRFALWSGRGWSAACGSGCFPAGGCGGSKGLVNKRMRQRKINFASMLILYIFAFCKRVQMKAFCWCIFFCMSLL